ncbi:geranylgeranyl pyrophosphate synthase [Holotrichia oblita]|uniref:Geranylgeranyl pyrophosphate synthase n=1 Tax=Holotrichia oblita TaxID=644536 RepID=A0ACB9TEJ9_HOLOL|nr:geranylgeranyl pyrophosphate synthase [Holotrichia oblita]
MRPLLRLRYRCSVSRTLPYCVHARSNQKLHEQIQDSSISEAERVVGYPTSFLNLRWLLSDEIANIAFHLRKLLGTNHPLLSIARDVILNNEKPSWSLIVLLVAKAGGHNTFFADIDEDKTAGDRFGTGKSSLSVCFFRIVKAVCILAPRFIFWPAQRETVKREFRKTAGIDGIVGAVDVKSDRSDGRRAGGATLIKRNLKFAGVLHSQRIVGEVTEMIRTSNSLHKGLITINDNNNDVLSMKIGNKVALLSGDYLLSSSYEQLARIRNHDLNELMSSAFKDLTENEFIGPRDRDNKPLPHKPEPENKELHIPNEFGITTSNFKHFLGHAKSEWILRSTLGGASLLGKACKGVLLLAGHHEDFQMNGYLLGKYLALCLEATRDYNSVFSDRNISPISAPVLFYLQRYPKFYSTFQQLINSENKFDDGDMRSKLQQSPALSDTILLQNELCEKTLSVLESFRNCDAKIALQNIVHSVKLHV